MQQTHPALPKTCPHPPHGPKIIGPTLHPEMAKIKAEMPDLLEIGNPCGGLHEIKTVKSVDEVLKIALVKELKPVEWIEVEKLSKSKTTETSKEIAH